VTDRWDTGRTEAFSDGVFAIAITLLVLDISIPSSQVEHLGRAVLDEWPAYLAYVTSFMTVGGLWLVHASLFSRLRFIEVRLIRLNLLLLMAVSFLPFPTRLMADSLKYPHSERTAVLIYGANMLAIAVVIAIMYRVAANRSELLDDGVEPRQVRELSNRIMPSAPAIVAAFALAIVEPRLAAFAYLVIAIAMVLGAHGARVEVKAADSPQAG
jgi:uncharacterized membrane protein